MNMPNYPIYFDGQNLANIAGVAVYNYEINQLPPRSLTINKIAGQDLGVLTNHSYGTKEIVVYAHIGRDNRDGTELALSELKTALQGVNKTLTVPQYGTNINYTTTLYSLDHEWDTPYLDATIILYATSPIGVDSNTTTLVAGQNITAQSFETSATVYGSYKAAPLLQVTFTDITDGVAQTVSVGNAASGQRLSITRTWVDADVLLIDCLNKTVQVNGAAVEYTGAFPTYLPGTAIISYVDSFTDRDVTLVATYNKRYI
jgi:phage-related protein